MASGSHFKIGEWTFSASEGTLIRGAECRRLEHRAAAVLQTLAERRGAIVNQQELIEAVWAGRAVSQNSVAITIADIRKALEDDARAPRFLETAPKRGYRLRELNDAPTGMTSPRRRWVMYPFVGVAIASLAIGAVALSPRGAQPPITIAIADFANDTGAPAFDPLAASVHELAVTDLGKANGIQILPSGSNAELTLRGKLIMWSGHPSAAVSVQDNSRRNLVWTGMASGPERALPDQMRVLTAELVQKLGKDTAR